MLYEANWKDVKDMYNYAKDNNIKLLSEYPSTFWSDYVTNYQQYDKQFMRMYRSYRYYIQDAYVETNDVAEITTDFANAVYMYLAMNDKRFSELYKIKVLDDSEVSILNGYKIVETMDGTKAYNGTFVDGTRSDSNTENVGSKTDTTTQQIEGFNSASFSDSNRDSIVYGQQQNSNSFIKGGQTNTDNHSEDNDYVLTKEGTVDNPYENIRKFQAVWTNFEFMTYIFKQICAEYLLA